VSRRLGDRGRALVIRSGAGGRGDIAAGRLETAWGRAAGRLGSGAWGARVGQLGSGIRGDVGARELAVFVSGRRPRSGALVSVTDRRHGIDGGGARIAAGVARFFVETFPREVRSSGRFIFACVALFALTAGLAYWLVTVKPSAVYALLPAQLIEPIHKSLHDTNFAFDRDYAATMSAAIIANNIRVAVMCFAGGMTLGIFTVYELIFTGFMVGGLGALFANAGFGFDYFATIAPHGIIELTSIMIASAAGMLLAAGVLAPGRLRRIDALQRNARRAGVLILGVCAMLVVAGSIEGFYSPQRFLPAARLGMGAVTAIAMIWYFSLCGRPRKSAPPGHVQLSGEP